MFPNALDASLRPAEVLIIVPPFGGLDRPALGPHILQACARARGLEVSVLYANMLLARFIGERDYNDICFASTSNLLGERFFSWAAYQTSRDVARGKTRAPERRRRNPANFDPPMGWERFGQLSDQMPEWCDGLAEHIAAVPYRVIGCTTTFEQTAASIALLRRIKTLRPDVVTIIGGANCEGRMASGMRVLAPDIDYVFAAESERTFPEFLDALIAGHPPDARIVSGAPCRELDAIPTPDFAEYYAQFTEWLPESEMVKAGSMWLPYESSRGCWWGEKSHCTFCGINGGAMVFRQKSPDRVIGELTHLLERHPTKNVCMVDNIMPHDFFETLLPRLGTELPGIHMFYEQKANLTLPRVAALKAAGVHVIQPGIEALSTPLLRLMKKGVTAAQNIALLRYARAVDLAVNWNLLWAFPGDRVRWYEETAALAPLLAHLNPPTGLCHLSIDRFSPYFERASDFQVTNLRPMTPYFDVLPEDASHFDTAYHFEGDYDSESIASPEVIRQLESNVLAWQSSWEPEKPRPVLEIVPLNETLFLLADTRGLPGTLEFEFIDVMKAAVALTGMPVMGDADSLAWALERKVCVEVDGKLVPLPTAPVAILQGFENTVRELLRRPAAASVVTVMHTSSTTSAA